MMTLEQLLKQPWTWEGPRRGTESGETFFEYRIRELPDFFVAGETPEEADRERIPALRAFLESYVDNGEMPPLPAVVAAAGFFLIWATRVRLEGSANRPWTAAKPRTQVLTKRELVT